MWQLQWLVEVVKLSLWENRKLHSLFLLLTVLLPFNYHHLHHKILNALSINMRSQVHHLVLCLIQILCCHQIILRCRQLIMQLTQLMYFTFVLLLQMEAQIKCLVHLNTMLGALKMSYQCVKVKECLKKRLLLKSLNMRSSKLS